MDVVADEARPPLSLHGQVAFVTGATGGIGWAIATCLAEHGADLVLGGRDRGALEQGAAALLERTGRAPEVAVSDVRSPADITAAFRAIHRRHRRLDIMVNNAGVLGDARLGMISEGMVDETLAVNTRAALLHTQGAARLMQKQGHGSIVQVTSIIGLRGNVGQCVYAASKAALVGLTLSAAKELAPSNIRVNAVAPGFIDTKMIRHLSADLRAQRLLGIRMGRVGRPEEVAHAVLFLASGLSTYVTGQVLGVDGAMDVL